MVTTPIYRALLTFRLGTQQYALPIEQVIEVAAMVAVTTMPDAAPAVLGVANRHGAALPMVDLRRAFQIAAADLDVSTLFIVAENGTERVGLVVDEVYQVKYIATDALKTAQGAGQYMTHIASAGDQLLQLIDLPQLLAAVLSDNNRKTDS